MGSFGGPSSAEKSVSADQNSFFKTMVTQQGQMFGYDSQIFNELTGGLSPIFQAGPSQHGFSPSELASLNSSAINNNGIANRNAKAAAGNAIAASGGGNANLPSGVNANLNARIGQNFAEKTAEDLNRVNAADWETGRENWKTAAAGLSKAPEMFNNVPSMGSATSRSGSEAFSSADTISKEQNAASPWNFVTKALGSIANVGIGALTGGIGNKITGALGGKGLGNGDTSGNAAEGGWQTSGDWTGES